MERLGERPCRCWERGKVEVGRLNKKRLRWSMLLDPIGYLDILGILCLCVCVYVCMYVDSFSRFNIFSYPSIQVNSDVFR